MVRAMKKICNIHLDITYREQQLQALVKSALSRLTYRPFDNMPCNRQFAQRYRHAWDNCAHSPCCCIKSLLSRFAPFQAINFAHTLRQQRTGYLKVEMHKRANNEWRGREQHLLR